MRICGYASSYRVVYAYMRICVQVHTSATPFLERAGRPGLPGPLGQALITAVAVARPGCVKLGPSDTIHDTYYMFLERAPWCVIPTRRYDRQVPAG